MTRRPHNPLRKKTPKRTCSRICGCNVLIKSVRQEESGQAYDDKELARVATSIRHHHIHYSLTHVMTVVRPDAQDVKEWNVTKRRISKSFMHRFLSEQIVVEFLSELISSSELSYICHGILDVSILPISMINDFKSVYLTAGRSRTEPTSPLVHCSQGNR